MPAKLFIVTLNADERERLEALLGSGKRSARTITRARVLLLADQGEHGPGWEDRRVAEALGCGHRTVERVRERFVTDGLDAALAHKKPASPPRERVLDGAAEARLIALACSATPDGRKTWTLRMLADTLFYLGGHTIRESALLLEVGRETVRRRLAAAATLLGRGLNPTRFRTGSKRLVR